MIEWYLEITLSRESHAAQLVYPLRIQIVLLGTYHCDAFLASPLVC